MLKSSVNRIELRNVDRDLSPPDIPPRNSNYRGLMHKFTVVIYPNIVYLTDFMVHPILGVCRSARRNNFYDAAVVPNVLRGRSRVGSVHHVGMRKSAQALDVVLQH